MFRVQDVLEAQGAKYKTYDFSGLDLSGANLVRKDNVTIENMDVREVTILARRKISAAHSKITSEELFCSSLCSVVITCLNARKQSKLRSEVGAYFP